jgi:predicted nucleotidyltransferase
LSELATWVRARFGPRVSALKLFGSRARGDATEESDTDVLVAVDTLTSAEGREIAHFCGDLLTKYDVVISPFALSTERFEELRRRERRIVQEIEQDGVSL